MTYHELVSKTLRILFTGKTKFHCILPTEMKNVYVPYRFEKSEEEFFLDLTTKKQARSFTFRQKKFDAHATMYIFFFCRDTDKIYVPKKICTETRFFLGQILFIVVVPLQIVAFDLLGSSHGLHFLLKM